MEHLSIKEIHDRLEEIKDWELIGHEITKEFDFKNSKEAMEFVQKVGEETQREHHFQEIFVRHNKVTITLTTHDEGGLTYKDFKLAKIIEQLV